MFDPQCLFSVTGSQSSCTTGSDIWKLGTIVVDSQTRRLFFIIAASVDMFHALGGFPHDIVIVSVSQIIGLKQTVRNEARFEIRTTRERYNILRIVLEVDENISEILQQTKLIQPRYNRRNIKQLASKYDI